MSSREQVQELRKIYDQIGCCDKCNTIIDLLSTIDALWKVAEAAKDARTMTNELLRTMDEDHWYRDDLVKLRVGLISSLAALEEKK